MLRLVALAQRGSRAQALYPAVQTRILGVKWLCPAPQLRSVRRSAARATAIQDGGGGGPCAETLRREREQRAQGPPLGSFIPSLLRRSLESSSPHGLSGRVPTLRSECSPLRFVMER